MASFWVPVVWQLARGATPTRKERYGDRGNRSYLSEGGGVCQQAPAWDSSGSPCLYSEGLSSRARQGVPEMV